MSVAYKQGGSFLLYPTSNHQQNLIDFAFKIYPESDHFFPPPLFLSGKSIWPQLSGKTMMPGGILTDKKWSCQKMGELSGELISAEHLEKSMNSWIYTTEDIITGFCTAPASFHFHTENFTVQEAHVC